MDKSYLVSKNTVTSLEPLNRISPLQVRQINREIGRVVSQGLITEAKEQIRASLTSNALDNVGALSALEAHLIQIAPLGQDRYKHIVDAYAMGAAQVITRW